MRDDIPVIRRKMCSDLLDYICDELASGRPMSKICDEPGMPCSMTVRKWLRQEENSADLAKYARAREAQADALAEEIIEISDATGDPQRDRLRVDARKWYASKLNARAYGDKIEATHEVGDRLGSLLSKLSPTVIPGHARGED